MEDTKNSGGLNKKTKVLSVVGIFLLIIIAIGFIYRGLPGYQSTENKKTDKEVPDLNNQTRAIEIIENLLTSEGVKPMPEITVVRATNEHIKANLFFNPGGGYILAAKIGEVWKKVLEGNGIPECSAIKQYNFPEEIVPNCVNEFGLLTNNQWLSIKNAIANCEAKEVMQAHSLYVRADLKNGSRLEGFEPAIGDILRLAQEAEGKCGKILMATE